MSTVTKPTYLVSSAFGALVLLLGIPYYCLASENAENAPFLREERPLQPANRYSGRTPIDLNNGILFNNGTYGIASPTYEKWAQVPALVPGLSELPYPFSAKSDFVRGLNESAIFVQDAISNWRTSGETTKPEAKTYGEKSAATMEPLLKRFKDVIHDVDSSTSGDWEKVQADARRALLDLRGTYSSLHHNVK